MMIDVYAHVFHNICLLSTVNCGSNIHETKEKAKPHEIKLIRNQQFVSKGKIKKNF